MSLLPTSSLAPYEELYRFGADGNLRMYSYDRLFYSIYGYDGGTTRTYKYSFDLTPNWVNGQLLDVQFNPHNAMFYPNSYINFNQDGHYTKHYYNGMERIASRLGEQSLSINVNDPELQDRKWNITEITSYQFLEPGQEPDPDDPKPIFELPVIGLNNLQPSADGIFYYHPNHLGSTCYVTDENASVVQGFLYAPFGEITNEHSPLWQNGNIPKYAFNAKELDEETGFYYYEARYYNPPTFISRDPLFEKYPTFSPYAYCANNPVKFIDPTGEEWKDIEGNTITDHSNVKVYIFYDSRGEGEGFAKQSKKMAELFETFFGKGSVAMSDAMTMDEFAKDWGNMESPDIKIVALNYHGNNQTIMLNANKSQYITATGDGKTNRSGTVAKNVQDLPTPSGNINNAQLHLNTCKSNSKTQYELKGNKLTLMEAFYKSTNFKLVRRTSYGVSYCKKKMLPYPGHSWNRGYWDYMERPAPPTPPVYRKHNCVGLPPK